MRDLLSNRWHDSKLAQAALLFGLVFALFLPSARYEQLNLDDDIYVMNNTRMREGLTPKNVGWALTSVGYACNWHPLAWTSLMADVSLVRLLDGGRQIGEDEWRRKGNSVAHVMHFHNVCLHAFNAVLLFLLIAKLLDGKFSAVWPLGLALLWAVHPLRVEVVCWISERKELLCCTWMLLAVMFYVQIRPLGPGRYAAALGCAILAMLAKPVAVTLPAVLLAWDWIFGGRVRWLRLLPFGFLSAGTCLLTMMAQTDAIGSGREMGRLSQIRTIFAGPIIYVRQTLWPTGLSIAYEGRMDLLALVEMLMGVLLVVLLVALCIWWLKRRSQVLGILTFAVSWVYVGLVPMLGIVKVGGQEHSDRYTYWIGCGLCVSLALLAKVCVPQFEKWFIRKTDGGVKGYGDLRQAAFYGMFAVVVVWGALSINRMKVWRDTATLYRDAIPKSWCTEIAFALVGELINTGAQGLQESEMWLRACLKHCPSINGTLNLVDILRRKPVDGCAAMFGQPCHDEALLLLEGVLAQEPGNVRAKTLLAIIEGENRKARRNVQGQ